MRRITVRQIRINIDADMGRGRPDKSGFTTVDLDGK